MEILQTFYIMIIISMMKTVLSQSDVDPTRIERTASNSEDFPTETRISNKINLENNSSEKVIVKGSTVTAESTDASSIGVTGLEGISTGDNFDSNLRSDNEMSETLTSSSDLLLNVHGDVSGMFPSKRISEVPEEGNDGKITDIEEINGKSVSKESSAEEKSQLETAKTEIPGSETSASESFETNDFIKVNTNSNPFQTLGSTISDGSNAEQAKTTPADFSASATESLIFLNTAHSEFKTSYTDGLTEETAKTETHPTSETLISLSSTETTDRKSKTEEDDFFNKNFEEQSKSRHSLSTTEAELLYSNDSAFHGDSGHGSTSTSEKPDEQLVPNAPVTYTFREEHQSTEQLGFKMDDKVEEISYAVDEQDGESTNVESNTQRNTDDHSVRMTEEPVEDENIKVIITNDKHFNGSTEIAVSGASDDTVTEIHERREDITLSSSEISKSTDDSENNSTRIPKRIQEPRYTEARYRPRPLRPDPGYSYSEDRPYRPDDLLYSRGQKPAVDSSYTPLRRESDFSRPTRPDPYVPASEFSRHAPDYSRQSSSSSSSSSDSGASKPYRPQTSFARPYVPQGSFGRPYRPDRDHTKNVSPPEYYSKTTEEFPMSSKPDNIFFGSSQSETEFSELSHAEEYDGKTSEASEFEYQHPHSDVKPMVLTPDVFKPYRPPMDTRVSSDREDIPRPLRPVYVPSSSTVADNDVSKPVISEISSKPVSTPDRVDDVSRDSSVAQGTKGGEKSRPSGSYPRPGFGSNYGQPIGTSPKPFTPGTITLARSNLTRVEYIKADCFDNHMKVSIRFNGSFSGLVYSSGYSQDPTCSYINGSGRYHYEFFIRLNRCGTLGKQEVADQRIDPVTRRRQDRAQYLVNTVTVQYNPVIEEEIDEHFRVTCEYGYDFWKTVTFPVVSVETYLSRSSAMKVRTGSPVVFTLPPPQCNMEIRTGYGPSGSRVSGPVNVGDPLTLVIHMKSESAGFDILVSNCFAHNGAQKRLQLIDSNGCVVQEKLVSPFRGVSSPDRSQQVTLYSYLKAFRFTGSPALYIECDVHMCHGSCPPQRCYWRHLYKRSVENETVTPTEDPVISESVSLFQSLEVRNEESDRPNSLAVSAVDGQTDEDTVCFRSAGFAAILASVLVVLVVTCLTSICLCSRIRKMKTYFESTDTKHFIQFDINTQRK